MMGFHETDMVGSNDYLNKGKLQPLIDQLCAPGELPGMLNKKVLAALGFEWEHAKNDNQVSGYVHKPSGKKYNYLNVVASLDDQKAIMPEGWVWHEIISWFTYVVAAVWHSGRKKWIVAKAPTEERARLAAILKAVSYECV